MRKHILAGILSWAALCVAAKPEQEPDSTAHVLREVTVAQSPVKAASRSAAPMRVVDSEQMLRTGVTDVSDALHRMPGVTLRDYGGAGGLKTVSVRGFGASHTGVVIDGVPLSDVQSGQIDLARYSVDNVSKVSMVVGDNDDIFIPARLAASAATVSLSTSPPTDAAELTAKMKAGSFGFLNPYLRVGTPLGEDAAVNFVGEFTHARNDYPFRLTNGSLVTTERRNNSRTNGGNAELNFVCHPLRGATLTSKAYYYGNSRRLPGPVVYYNNINNERLREQNAMAQASLRTPLRRGLSMLVNAKFNFAASLYYDQNGKYPGGELRQNYRQREYYASAALLCAPGGPWLFDYSADWYHNNLNSNLPTDIRPFRNSLLQSATAKYRTRRLSVMARALWSVYRNGAARGEAAADASRVSPSVCLSVQPLEAQMLFVRASYKNIFRMPTFNEAYFDHYGSKDIRPESTDQLNIGATYTFRPAGCLADAMVSADAYVNNVRDMIVAVPYNMFIWSMTNLGKVRVVGVDATADLSLTPGRGCKLGLSVNYSYQRAMPRTSPQSADWMKQVAYIPRHSGNASLSCENPWACVAVHFTAVSERFTTNSNLPATRIAPYTEFGASAWRHFRIDGHTLGLRLDLLNAFNRQYCIVARYPMPGRSLRATLSFSL